MDLPVIASPINFSPSCIHSNSQSISPLSSETHKSELRTQVRTQNHLCPPPPSRNPLLSISRSETQNIHASVIESDLLSGICSRKELIIWYPGSIQPKGGFLSRCKVLNMANAGGEGSGKNPGSSYKSLALNERILSSMSRRAVAAHPWP